MRRLAELALGAALSASLLAAPALAQDASPSSEEPLAAAARDAQQALRQTFTNLQFEDFGPAPVKGPLYQANAGGRMIYFAPESGHLLFAAVYDRNGVNVTALAQDASARKRLGAIDTSKALAIGPQSAPVVIEFTDPDCPYCQALDRFWSSKAAEGKQVRRLVFFVSGIHPQAAAKAEHILCAADPEAAFRAVYSGSVPKTLGKCAEGATKVAAHAEMVRKLGVSGTPTLFADGKLISGFQQAEIEAFLDAKQQAGNARP
ncbi:DsbC family protein [Sphingomonas sp. MG17]|uniref:Thiol:disulfide interchange protein n=1 Tax=Sphingomonas tagetis TaxID=2949092 RepID=A0A9X2KQV2_9SPHN|nr:DsbC family protein [Sphingomonas tagetis]MCP3732178.1 DsbC family protein [Sphingomonas tagetis]